MMGKLNPDLLAKSRKIDANNQKIAQLQQEKVNLQKAQELLYRSA
jgi:hypothetical protein